MTAITLYHMPGSCSNVTLNALEEIGLLYEDRGVALMRGEQRQPAFLAINPKGKVPVLVIDGRTLTEAPVILYHLATRFADAGLLPIGGDPDGDLACLSDLVWCADTLHHCVTGIFRPGTIAPDGADSVRATAIARLTALAQPIEERLLSQAWWYGEEWSIVDVFVAWVMATAALGGFPLADFPALSAHRARVEDRPSFRAAAARGAATIARDGLAVPAA